MTAPPSNSEAWRLSRIAEEADSISFSSTDDGSHTSSGLRSRIGTLERSTGTLERNLYARSNGSAEEIVSKRNATCESKHIYSNAIIIANASGCTTNNNERTNDVYDVTKNGVYDVTKTGDGVVAETQSRDALRFIKEKYDSLGKMKIKKPELSSSSLETCRVISASSDQRLDIADVIMPIVKNDVMPLPRADICSASRTLSSLSLASSSIAPQVIPAKKYASVNAGPRLSIRTSGSYDAEQSYVSPFSNGCLFPLTPTTSPFSSSTVVNSVSDGVLSETISASSRTHSHPGLSTVTSRDLQQVEMFYSSHKTTVCVCPCMAGLYTGNVKSLALSPPSIASDLDQYDQSDTSKNDNHWTFLKSGIPVLVLDSGESRRKRRLHIVIAEKGTGFTLWRDSMDHLSEYTVRSTTFHTMYLSNDHARIVGFCFDRADGAAEFFKNLRHMTSDSSEKSVLNLSDGGWLFKKKSTAKDAKAGAKKTKGRLCKAAISQPCCFTHVTQLDGQNLKTVLRSSGLWREVPSVDNDSSKCVERTETNGIVVAVKVAGIKHKS